jgi:hypothetical protein
LVTIRLWVFGRSSQDWLAGLLPVIFTSNIATAEVALADTAKYFKNTPVVIKKIKRHRNLNMASFGDGFLMIWLKDNFKYLPIRLH